MNIEEKISHYIANYFTKDEKLVLQRYYFDKYESDDTQLDDPEYVQLSKFCKMLLKTNLSDNYNIEVGPTCRFLINRLVETYVDDQTLVLTTEQEHSSVKNALKNSKNQIIINVNDLYKNETLSNILNKYKELNCNKIFLIMAGTLPGTFEVIDQQFFISLKNILSYNNIPNIFILDDCQGCGFIFRDYNMFDGILATGHVFIPGFDMGILFTKLNKKIGYYNKTGLKHLNEKISIVLKHRDKALEFNNLLSEYFDYDLNNLGVSKFNNQAPHRFALKIEQSVFTQEQYDDLIKYKVRISDSDTIVKNISIRCHEIMIQSPNKVIEGLKHTKKLLKKIHRAKDLAIDNQHIYTNKKIIDDHDSDNELDYLNDFYQFDNETMQKVKMILQTTNSKVR